MELTPAQMRAIELILEQTERLNSFAVRRMHTTPMDIIVREFYRDSNFELSVLNKIGKLLAPESGEDLNLTVSL